MSERIRPGDLWSNIYGKRIVPGEDPTPIRSSAEIPSDTLLKDQLAAKLLRMTPEERLVFQLRFGLTDGRARTWGYIAREIGRSPTTARRRLTSALHQFSLRPLP